jgi:hypothetical protein
MTFGSGVPFVVACSGSASSSSAPCGSLGPRGLTHRSRRASFGATIARVIASSELSRIGSRFAPLWTWSAVPGKPKQLRYVLTSATGVGPSPRIATRTPCPCNPAACSGAIPYAVRIWFGNSPALDTTATGKADVAQPGAIVPVRVGVPPAYAAALADACWVTESPRPEIVSTLPFRPEPSFGVATGSARSWSLVLVE